MCELTIVNKVPRHPGNHDNDRGEEKRCTP